MHDCKDIRCKYHVMNNVEKPIFDLVTEKGSDSNGHECDEDSITSDHDLARELVDKVKYECEH